MQADACPSGLICSMTPPQADTPAQGVRAIARMMRSKNVLPSDPLTGGVNRSAPGSESLPLPPQTPPPPSVAAVLAGSPRRGRPQPQRGAGRSSRPGGAAAAASSCRTELQPCRRRERRRPPRPTSPAHPPSLPSPFPAPCNRAGKSRSSHQTFLLPSLSPTAGPRATL